ncbi:hypothetical protein AB691_1943 [Stutzerimonas stutzeri]|nr:hypothetical protein AB691_1943 [Stutzerimonas stutzeri]
MRSAALSQGQDELNSFALHQKYINRYTSLLYELANARIRPSKALADSLSAC